MKKRFRRGTTPAVRLNSSDSAILCQISELTDNAGFASIFRSATLCYLQHLTNEPSAAERIDTLVKRVEALEVQSK